MKSPDRLSVNPKSPHYDMDVARRIDKVRVDGVHVPDCAAYDKIQGWAMAITDGVWQPKVYGKVTVGWKSR